MIALNAHYDGKVIIPDEPLDLPADQQLRITIEPVVPDPTKTNNKPPRTFGQQKGVVLYVAPDFDEYLGDDFWGLSDETAK
jgi:hypothetical protein